MVSLLHVLLAASSIFLVFFFDVTTTSYIYTLSLHDALPIFDQIRVVALGAFELDDLLAVLVVGGGAGDRKSTRLNSSHVEISYAVFCLKKKICLSSWLLQASFWHLLQSWPLVFRT